MPNENNGQVEKLDKNINIRVSDEWMKLVGADLLDFDRPISEIVRPAVLMFLQVAKVDPSVFDINTQDIECLHHQCSTNVQQSSLVATILRATADVFKTVQNASGENQ